MAIEAKIYSEGPGVESRIITLRATGVDTGHITIEPADHSASPESFDLYGVAADAATLEIVCKVRIFFSSPELSIAVKSDAAG